MNTDLSQEIQDNVTDDWNCKEDAMEGLYRFCIYLNYHFQGAPAEVDMPDNW